MKRILGIAAITLLVTVGLSGCGDPDQGSQLPAIDKKTGERST
jgi:hypothetical protein